MRVLYLGAKDLGSTSRHRAEALRRLGCTVEHLDPFDAALSAKQGLRGAIHYRTGYLLINRSVVSWLKQHLLHLGRFELCWVDSGEVVSRAAIEAIKSHCGQVVLFNHDDPTGPRDRLRFQTLRRAIPAYDLCLAVRDINVPEFEKFGAKDVLKIWRSYDECAHRPDDPNRPISSAFCNDIAFIGRQMDGEGRDDLMLHLIQRGLKPAIWGDNWQNSKVWRDLQPYWRGESLAGQNYVDAIRGAKVCLGMLSKGNRDHHTTRTMEIPAAGGLLCAERTDEHTTLYREGEEAVFWSSPQECADVCQRLLAEPDWAARIREKGMQRVVENRVGNEDICRQAIERLGLTLNPS